MNSNPTNSSSTIEIPAVTPRKDSSPRRASTGSRCEHRFPNGKRCRKYATDSHFGLCLNHYEASAAIGAGLKQPPNDSLDLSPDLLPQLSEFDSAVDIISYISPEQARGTFPKLNIKFRHGGARF